MLDTASPPTSRLRQPRWLDVRLLVGLLLVLSSVVVGARVVAGASSSVLVWRVASDLAAGTPLGAEDVSPVEVRLGTSAVAYLDATEPEPVGWVLLRPVGAGELLPRAALAAADAASEQWRIVTVPVERFHYPGDLAKGEQVDVYVTTTTAAGSGTGPIDPELVLRAVTVARIDAAAGELAVVSAAGIGVELAVPQANTELLVRAAQSGAIDLVRVPQPGQPAAGAR